MQYYDSVAEALNALAAKGYTTDFSLLKEQECIYCHNTSQSLSPDEFVIDEVHRFEGATDPDDEMIVYAISSEQYKIKGTLVNAFGAYADADTSHIIEKLKYRKEEAAKPIKRSEDLIQLSREHHHALLLCWKIKNGLAKDIALPRIIAYANWFYVNHLLPHFVLEEKFVFPILSKEDLNRQKAEQQHTQLRALFERKEKDQQTLTDIQNILTDHIRFEERVVFNEAQKLANPEQLKKLQEIEFADKICDNESDPFWK